MHEWHHSPFKLGTPPPRSPSLDDSYSLSSHAGHQPPSVRSSPTPSARSESARARSGSKSPFRFHVSALPNMSAEAERTECSLQFAEHSLEEDMKAIRDELRQVRRMIGDLR